MNTYITLDARGEAWHEDLTEEQRDEVRGWMRRHGLEPNEVLGCRPSVIGDPLVDVELVGELRCSVPLVETPPVCWPTISEVEDTARRITG